MVEKEGQVTGLYFKLLHETLNEYNPDIYKEIAKNLSFDINDIGSKKWLPFSDLLEYFGKLSSEARFGIAKFLFPRIKKMLPIFNECTNPIEVLEKVDALSGASYKDMERPHYEIVESGDEFARIRITNSPYVEPFPELDEGLIRGAFSMFNILAVNVNVTKEDSTTAMIDVKWENR